MADVFRMGFLLIHELDLFLELLSTIRHLLLKRGDDRILLSNGLLMRMDSLLHSLRVSCRLDGISSQVIEILLQTLDLQIATLIFVGLLSL